MLEIIKGRRSIRRYKTDPIPEERIASLLEAAMYAPSARNGQPWHFVVCDDRGVIDALRAEHPYASMLETAPVCVVVCGEGDAAVPGYWQQDCAAATENLLIAAHGMGLGTCWMGVAPREDRMEPVRRVLGLPKGIEPFNMIAVGYPDERPKAPARYRTDRIHRNRWGAAEG